MTPVYIAILSAVGNVILIIAGFAWKVGRDNQKLETLREAHNELADDMENMKDVDVELTKEVANIRGYLRGESGAPINGGAN